MLRSRQNSDKASPEAKKTAHITFQQIAFAYAILSDQRRRKRYDTTGNTSESLDIEGDNFNWTDFFRAQWNDAVTTTSIEGFKGQYQGSDEEMKDLLNAYRKTKGDMNKLFAEVMLSNPLHDEERFRSLIDNAINTGKVKPFDKYLQETANSKKKRRQRAEREAKEAEEHMQHLEKEGKGKKSAGKGRENGVNDLAAMIQQRQQGRAKNFLDDLEAKYAAPKGKGEKKGGPKKRKEEEPPEEAFEKAAARASKKRKVAVEEDADEKEEDDDEDVDLAEESAVSEKDEEDEEKEARRTLQT